MPGALAEQGRGIGRELEGRQEIVDAVIRQRLVDRGGKGVNLEEHFYDEAFLIR